MRIGIITGSGTYALPGFSETKAVEVETRFGTVPVNGGTFAGAEVLHVSRHREGHALLSSGVTHQANVTALEQAGAEAVLAVTVCGACDPSLRLRDLIVFDDLFFPANRLPDGSLCTLHTEPGQPGRGHWIFDEPFAPVLRDALLQGAGAIGHPVRDGGTYGHVDGPRFNTRAEIRWMGQSGATAVSQTAGPETVLCGEAELPYALLGYATDWANGVQPEPTPPAELIAAIEASTATFAGVLEHAVRALEGVEVPRNGSAFSWD